MVDQTVHPEAERVGGWEWSEPSRGEHFRRCGYCSSIHPEDLAAEPEWRADWADRKYGWPHKFYVNVANRTPGALFVCSCLYNHPGPPPDDCPPPIGSHWVAIKDLTAEQRAIAERDHTLRPGLDPPAYLAFGTRLHHFGKFYTIHLSDEGLDPGVKQAIEQRSGLAFTFHDNGFVSWGRAGTTPP